MHAVFNESIHLSMTIIFQSFCGKKNYKLKKKKKIEKFVCFAKCVSSEAVTGTKFSYSSKIF